MPALDPITAALNLGTSLIERFVADPAQQADAKLKLLEMQQNGELSQLSAEVGLMQAQIDVNKIDAASENFWQNGWRPGVGWAGVGALVLVYWPKAIVMTVIWTYQCWTAVHGVGDPASVHLPAFPDLGVTDLLGLLGSILGVGTLRTVEKHIATKQ